jgi:hypothetical protein
MGSAHAGDWRRAARGRRAQTLRETLALKLADGPSKPLGMKAHRAVVTARPLVARKMAKGRCARERGRGREWAGGDK